MIGEYRVGYGWESIVESFGSTTSRDDTIFQVKKLLLEKLESMDLEGEFKLNDQRSAQRTGTQLNPNDKEQRNPKRYNDRASDKSDAKIGALAGKYSDINALELLYGKYIVSEKYAEWLNIIPPHDFNNGSVFNVPNGEVKVVISRDYVISDKKKHVLITQTVPKGEEYNCHACGPLIGLTTFINESNRWNVESHNPFLTWSGEFGSPGKLKWMRVGDDRYCLVSQDSAMHQGYQGVSVDVYCQHGILFKEIFRYRTGQQDGNLSINVTFVRSENKGYHDIRIDRLSDSGNPGEHSKREIHIFKFIGNKYVGSQ